MTQANTVCIVGTGASAGGLQPMIEFFSAMPDEPGIAFVVVQHTDSTSRSQLPEILSRHSKMPIELAEDGTVIERDCIYVVPGHMHAALDGDRLRLTATERDGAFDVIDFFFRSLAASQRECAIGVLLSGTGSDGALGLREIRVAGGLSIAQDPEEATYDSMPAAAIRTGFVDRVLKVAEMPAAIVAYAQHLSARVRAQPEAELDTGARAESTVESIISFLRREHASDFGYYKRTTIARRIRRRMGICQIDSIEEYHRHIQEHPEEAEQLARDMLVGVTSFFRDPEAFEELRETVIRPLVEEKSPDTSIRIWVPGAATGEEAYSVAMLVHEVMAELGKNIPLQVFACDLNPEAVELARQGSYPESIRADVPEALLEKYFSWHDHTYRVRDRLREGMVFATHNMLTDPPFSRLDLVSCRNVLIYLTPQAEDLAYRVFAFALRRGGYIFLGSSDAPPSAQDMFAGVEGEARVLRRTAKKASIASLPIRARVRNLELVQSRSRGAMNSELARVSRDVLLGHFAAAVVLTTETGEVLHFFGPTSKYLEHTTGQATLSVFDMVAEPLSTRMRAAMREARDQDREQKLHGVRLGEGRQDVATDVSIIPAGRPGDEDRVFAFIFESALPRARERLDAEEAAGPGGESSVEQLTTDLAATRRDLQAVVAELQRSNEDLVVANDEVMSMNEELQSANEELQISTEELQSVNEELMTVNQQLNEKVDLIAQANADLETLFKSADIMAVFIAEDLSIRRFSPAAARLLNLLPTDVGRPISHVTHNLRDLDLPPMVEHVINTGEGVEEQLQDTEGNWYIMSIASCAMQDQLEGAVVNFANVTRVKMAEQLAARRTEKLRELAREITEAEQSERHRIAGLIHDEIQQMLAAAKMKVHAIARATEEPEVDDRVRQAVELLDSATATSRTLTTSLSPPVLRDAGFIAGLNWIAAEFKRTHGLRVTVEVVNRTEPPSDALGLFLMNAVRELLFNVVKHAETDEAELRLSRADEEVTIDVIDHGVGFDVCELKDAQGLSFGLVGIIRRMELLGGEFDLTSATGGGCHAALRLPAAVFDRPGTALSRLDDYKESARIQRGDAERPRVLIVDDHEIIRDGLARMLASGDGVEVVGTAADGHEAIELAVGLQPDVILMDIGMKPMNGIEATRIIMEQHPTMRIIGLSIHEEGKLSREIREAGAAGFLTKGAPIEEIIAAIRGKAEEPSAGNEPPATS